MSTIQRNIKRGNVRTFQESYIKGYQDAWATEVDADFDTLFNSWNFGLNGDLALADNSVTTPKLADFAVTNQKLGQSSVGSGNLIFGSITTPALQSLCVTNDKIATGAVDGFKLAANSVDASKILDGSVGPAELAANSVTTVKIADLNVTTPKIADGAVTDAKVLSLSWGKITGAPTGLPPSGPAGGSLQGTYPDPTLKPNSVTSTEILDGSIAAAELAPNVVARFVPPYSLADENKVLEVGPGAILTWVTTPPATLIPGQVTTQYIADAPNGVTDAKISTVSWGKITGAPTGLPPSGPAGGDLQGTYPNPLLRDGLIPASLPPSGGASGDLTGNYPGPTIRTNAITDAKVADVGWPKITGAPTSFPPSGPAGGDLAGSYPNPTVTAVAKSKWQVSGTTLTPLDAASEVYIPTTTPGHALKWGATTVKGRLISAGATGVSYWSNNMVFNAGGTAWLSDDATRPSWLATLPSSGDTFSVYRAPAGNPNGGATLMALDSVAQLALRAPGRTTATRLFPSPTAEIAFLSVNRYLDAAGTAWLADDATKPSWGFFVDAGSDNLRVARAPAGSPNAPVSVLVVDSAANLTAAGRLFIGSASGLGSLQISSSTSATRLLVPALITANSYWDGTWKRDDVSKGGWGMGCNAAAEQFVVQRDAGAGPVSLLSIFSDGKTYCTLANTSVTRPMMAVNSSWQNHSFVGVPVSFQANAGVWTTVCSVAPTTRGSACLVWANPGLSWVPSTTANTRIYNRLLCDGADIVTVSYSVTSAGGLEAVNMPGIMGFWGIGAGVHTFSLQVYVAIGVILAAPDTAGRLNVLELS